MSSDGPPREIRRDSPRSSARQPPRPAAESGPGRRPPPRPGRIFHVPGRIEVLGKHVDYAGGRSLLCATSLGFTFEVRPADDGLVRLRDRVSDQRATIEVEMVDGEGSRGPVWSTYPRAVIRRLRDDFDGVANLGCDIVFSSDLPSAAGLSSSSAFTTGVLLCLDAVSGVLDSDRARSAIPSLPDLADYVGAIESGRAFGRLEGRGFEGRRLENGESASDGGEEGGGEREYPGGSDRGVGVRGGSQDHTAILCSRPASLLQARFGPVDLERYVSHPPDLVFVIGVSGVRASKAAGARARFNHLSDLASRIAELWRTHAGSAEPHLGAILDAAPDAGSRLRDILEREAGSHAADMVRRVEQFRLETRELVPGVAEALERGDLTAVGERVDTSQRLAETHLGNQVPETIHLARSAREVGAIAASSFGAGFGGAVWALVEEARAEQFVTAWRASYRAAFPRRASRARFVVTRPSDPAGPLPARFARARARITDASPRRPST